MSSLPPPPDVVELATSYWQSSVLNAALELNLFPALAAQPMDAATLAHELDCSAFHMEALCDTLRALGVLCGEADAELSIHPELKAFLDPSSPESLLQALEFNRDLVGLWSQLGRSVKEGVPVIPDLPHLGNDPARTERFVRGMHSRAGIMARALIPSLIPESGSRILDIGSGPGTFSFKLLERDPSLQVTLHDLPPVLDISKKIHAEHPSLSHVSFLPGDYHSTEFPEGMDAALFCGALHQEPEAGLPAIFAKMFNSIVPGGRVWLVDQMLQEDRATPASSSLFHINMMLMRPRCRVHRITDLSRLLQEAGFSEISDRAIPQSPYHLIEARKAQ